MTEDQELAQLSIRRTDEVASYLRQKLTAVLASGEPSIYVSSPLTWNHEFLAECDRAVSVIAAALKYTGKILKHRYISLTPDLERTSWDARRYSDKVGMRNAGQNANSESLLQTSFPPIHEPAKYEIKPMVIINKFGSILLWYLPGILSNNRQVRAHLRDYR